MESRLKIPVHRAFPCVPALQLTQPARSTLNENNAKDAKTFKYKYKIALLATPCVEWSAGVVADVLDAPGDVPAPDSRTHPNHQG